MAKSEVDRRAFVRLLGGSLAAVPVLSDKLFSAAPDVPSARYVADQSLDVAAAAATPKLKFAVIGINHYHIYSQTEAVLRGGGELVWLYAREPDLSAAFLKRFPQAKLARS